MNEGFRKYKLNNGLVVSLQNIPSRTVSVRANVHYGAADEKEDERGMAHFLEHCLVTGGSENYSPLEAQKNLERFGYSNAFTTNHKTFFEGNMLVEDLGEWLRQTADQLKNPRFDLQKVEMERRRIMREIADDKSTANYLRSREIKIAVYGNHPKGIYVAGNEEVVANADIDKLRRIHQKGYGARNTELLVVGDLPKNIDEIILENFDGMREGEDLRDKFQRGRLPNGRKVIRQYVPEMLNIEKPYESSAFFQIAFDAPICEELDNYPVKVMSSILGGASESMLFQRLSNELGLAYAIGSSHEGEQKFGVMEISGNFQALNLDSTKEAIFDLIDEVKEKGVEAEKLRLVKKKARYTVAGALESHKGHIYVMENTLESGENVEDHLRKLDNVTVEQVNDAANKYLPKRDGDYITIIKDPLKK